MDLSLTGKRALVTGASRGIGRAIAAALVAEGTRVMLCAREPLALDEATRAVGGTSVSADVSTEEGAARAVQSCIDTLGGIDILVNNVGGSMGSGAFDKATLEEWRAVVDRNLFSAVYCSKPAVDWMQKHGGGSIVHIASVYGREYGPPAAYVAAKAGVIALAKEMGVDLARYGIRVNSVAPGSILFSGGSWDKRAKSDPARVQKMLAEELPFGRFGTPEEVARAVTFLASPAASWITGVCLPVDGGQGRAI